MKRRNAESGKMRRPIKRTKIPEGMYSNSLLYLKFVMLWATVVMADYMMDFRFEFLWPFWMMMRSVYDSFKIQGLAFSVLFICIAITSDLLCFFFMPMSWMFIAASTYVWMQCVWYTVADKGMCLPTMALCCLIAYVEGSVRAAERGGGSSLELTRPLAAHCVGYPVVTLGIGVKAYVGHTLKLRQRQPEHRHPASSKEGKDSERPVANGVDSHDHKHMNGSAVKSKKCSGKVEQNGHLQNDQSSLNIKLDKLEKHLIQSSGGKQSLSNGSLTSLASNDEEKQDSSKGSTKSSKCDKKESSTVKEEKKKNKNRDKEKDKENADVHKSTDNSKESIKEVESTKENTKCNNNNSNKDKDKEKEKEKEKEREKELKSARVCAEELRRVRVELSAARAGEAEARRALAAAAAADRVRRHDHQQLRAMHQQLQNKLSAWRGSERAALERRLGEERRARTSAEQQLQRQSAHQHTRRTSECESEWCASRRSSCEAESAALRRDLQRARDRHARALRDLSAAAEQIRTLESSRSEPLGLPSAYRSLQERAAHLERALSAETRVKLDLLSALGEAKRQLTIRENLITKQEKEMEELKAQMLAVMPPEYVSGMSSAGRSKLLDPNASVYTPKQLCSDA